MAIASSYLRFSSAQQSTGDSIRRQGEATAAWCVRNDTVLDVSMTLRDEGISAFWGKHRENPDTHALAAFVWAVNSGRVPAGSDLIVESLDRLSREKIRPARTLLLNLIEGGIKVVQLTPVEVVDDEDVERMTLLMAIVELNRGYSESKVMSERLAVVWSKKHKAAGTTKKIVSKQLPNWMRCSGEKIVLDAKAAVTVRRIIALAKDNGRGRCGGRSTGAGVSSPQTRSASR